MKKKKRFKKKPPTLEQYVRSEIKRHKGYLKEKGFEEYAETILRYLDGVKEQIREWRLFG